MILKIDNKKFVGKLNKDSIIIELKNNVDITFFAKWAILIQKSCFKHDYVKNIDFETVSREGIFEGTYPVLDINEEFVEIKFDIYTYEWKKFLKS